MRPSMNVSWALALSVAVALQQGCAGGEEEGGEEAPVVTSEVGEAVVRPFAVTVTAIGVVSATPGRAARVAAPGESFVTAVRVGPGDRVAAGSPLVELDRSVWSQQAAQADAALSAAEEAHARAQRLVEQGILARKDLETAAADLAGARAAAAEAHRTLERAVLRAPIAGVVSSVSAVLGQPVAAGDVLTEVVDDAGLEALVQLTPQDAAQVAAKAPVTILGGLDRAAPPVAAGSVLGVGSTVDASSGTVTARIALTSVDAPLRPGQTVSARITVTVHETAVVVPRASVVPITDGMVVFVVDAEGVAHATPIQLGAGMPDSVEVLSGLSGGERVVTTGAYGVVDGARVQPAGTP